MSVNIFFNNKFQEFKKEDIFIFYDYYKGLTLLGTLKHQILYSWFNVTQYPSMNLHNYKIKYKNKQAT